MHPTPRTWQEAGPHLTAAIEALVRQRDHEAGTVARRMRDVAELSAGAARHAERDHREAVERLKAVDDLVTSIGALIHPHCPHCGVDLSALKYPITHAALEGQTCSFRWDSRS